MKIIHSLMIFLLSSSLFAQEDTTTVSTHSIEGFSLAIAEDSLKTLAKTMMTNQELDNRTNAADSFLRGLSTSLQQSNSFIHPFDSLNNISKLYDTDSTFRILTWQLYIDKDEYKYYGIIQHKAVPKKGIPVKVTILKDFSNRMRKIEDKVYSADNWYGALYYNIQPFKTKEGMKYALFGFDAYRFFEKRKLLEILSFDEKKEPIFGAPLIQYFIKKKDQQPREVRHHRFLLEYSAEASVRINYDKDEGIILFDNLIPMASRFPDIPFVLVPDGSYSGFKFKKGLWEYVEKVYNHSLEDGQAPRPSPVLDQRKKDILGRQQK